MSYESRLEQIAKQQNILTQKQVESLEILSMGMTELIEFVNEEQLSNPVLEMAGNYEFREAEKPWQNGGSTGDSLNDYFDIPSEDEESLAEYLISQIPTRKVTARLTMIFKKLIENIDTDTGFFMDNYEELKEELHCTEKELDEAIDVIQQFDPPGIGVFNLKQSLILQLTRKGELNPQLQEFIMNYLEEIKPGKISSICRRMKIPRVTVKEYIEKIQKLNPKPAQIFKRDKAQYIIPDVIADYHDNKWTVKMTAPSRSFVHLDKTYIKMAKDAKEPELVSYLNEKINRAKDIMAEVEQREDTIRSMIQLLLEVQSDYLLGRGDKKHWTQKQTAEILGVHPSTVNRAVKNKYISVPRGVMPIKDLFSNKNKMESYVSIEKKEKKAEVDTEKVMHEERVTQRELDDKVSEICLIAPTEKLIIQNSIVCGKYNKKVDSFRASLPEACDMVNKLTPRGAKVFISRRGTKKLIESQQVPIVEIGLSLSDYIPYMEKAKKAGGKVGFFSFGIISEDVRSMCYLLGIDALYYCFHDISQCEEMVKEAINDGVILGIGGADTAVASQKLGLKHLIVENSEQSLLQAIEAAEQLLEVQKEEKKRQDELKIKLERYEMVFNYTHDAIIAVDEDGTIDVLNSRAEDFISFGKRPYIGRKINQVIADTRLDKLVKTGEKEINQLMNMNGALVSVNRIPIIVDGTIKGAVATFQDIKTIQSSEQKIRVKLHEKGLVAKYHFNDIIGESEKIQDVIRMAEKFSKSDATILIYGESGTGKELFAQSIHNCSRRKDGPFVAVNCGSLPKDILEAELFGYEDGAFTGARKGGKIGLFEMAHRGTIFLDEIGEMPLETQVQLLRVLQEKEIRRLGSDRVTPVDIRIITATNRNLPKEIKEGRFREDLYYRLNVLNLMIPPLRERKEDVIDIGINTYCKFAPDEKEGIQIVKNILDGLYTYTWPGNVRELHNLIERIYVLFSQGEDAEFIEKYIYSYLNQEEKENVSNPAVNVNNTENEIRSDSDIILEALRAHNYEMSKTAKVLGMSRSTLWRKIKKYNIIIPES